MIGAGIDPAIGDGCGVILIEREPLVYELAGLVSWHKTRRRSDPYDVRVVIGKREEQVRAPSFERAVMHLSEFPVSADRVYVEGQVYRVRGGKKRTPESMTAMGYASGFAAACVPNTPTTVYRRDVLYSWWRPMVLKIPANTDGERAKELALRAAQGRPYGSRTMPPWRILGGDVVQSHDEAEAVCVAVLAMMEGAT